MTLRDHLATVDTHLCDACERLSELLASLRADDHVSREMMIVAVEEHAQAILTHVWMARWQMPMHESDDPQRMNVADWPANTESENA